MTIDNFGHESLKYLLNPSKQMGEEGQILNAAIDRVKDKILVSEIYHYVSCRVHSKTLDKNLKNLENQVMRFDRKNIILGSTLIVFGFILQIIGAIPCPIDQLPNHLKHP